MVTSLSQVTRDVTDFIHTLQEEVRSGFLLFGGPLDIIISILDIFVTAFVIYYLLRILADSRAWQLLKGLLLIFVLTQFFGLLGLRTISYLMVSSISVLTFGLVVLFQPELRRTLESVGRNSFRMLSNVSGEMGTEVSSIHNVIESIAVACDKMSETYTGALIIIERKTSLGELLKGETTVFLDAELTATALQQIFYKGSPLHDGAVLIRNGRILAARIHVPLSDNFHLRKDYGTRHRAAVGASEIGDAVGIVVSEERGAISLTVGGRLYSLENADALRAVMHRLLAPEEEETDERKIRTFGRGVLRFFNPRRESKEELTENGVRDQDRPEVKVVRRRQLYLKIISLLVALLAWFYVQVVTNPIKSRNYTVPIQTLNVESLWDRNLSYTKSDNIVTLVIKARQNTIDSISAEQIDATIDFGDIASPMALINMEVEVKISGVSDRTYTIISRNPPRVPVLITEVDEGALPDERSGALPVGP